MSPLPTAQTLFDPGQDGQGRRAPIGCLKASPGTGRALEPGKKNEGATGVRLEGKVRAEVDIGTGWCQAQRKDCCITLPVTARFSWLSSSVVPPPPSRPLPLTPNRHIPISRPSERQRPCNLGGFHFLQLSLCVRDLAQRSFNLHSPPHSRFPLSLVISQVRSLSFSLTRNLDFVGRVHFASSAA